MAGWTVSAYEAEMAYDLSRDMSDRHEYECDVCGECWWQVHDRDEPCPDGCGGTTRKLVT